MAERRGRYKQLLDVNSLGGPPFTSTYAEFLQSKRARGENEEASLRVRVRPSTGDPRHRARGVTSVVARARQSLDDSDKRLKIIDEHMWQHRQEERDLRRAENDISRNQREVRRSLKTFEMEVEKRQKDETNWLLGQQSKHVQSLQRTQHEVESTGRERSSSNRQRQTATNEATKDYIKKEGELSTRYKHLAEALELKRNEVQTLGKTFEARIRSKEEEEHRIKQELAELAISLNMEAMKKKKADAEAGREAGKTGNREIKEEREREERLLKERKDLDAMGARHEQQSRQLSKERASKVVSVRASERRQGRSLAAVQSSLEAAHSHHKTARRAKEGLEAELVHRDQRDKMSVVNIQRASILGSYQANVQERNGTALRSWQDNTAAMLTEQSKARHQDRIKQLQREVGRADQQEQKMYSQVKEAEAERRKQEAVIEKVQQDLDALKRDNSKKLKEAAVVARKAEQELEYRLLREKSDLMKALNQREEGMKEVAQLRHRAKEDRKMLQEEKKGHDRRVRISNQSELLTN